MSTFDEGRPNRWDLAIDSGYEPSRGDDAGQPVMAPGEWDALPADDPSKKRIAVYEHTRPMGCRSCGARCDTCDERMCAEFGPEPSTDDNTCRECAATNEGSKQ